MAIRARHLVFLLRTERHGHRRDSAAIAVGVFIGCLPVYGFHLLICTAAGTVLRLNRLKMYLAANISNPLIAPVLVVLEVQAGAWLRRGAFYAPTVETMKGVEVATVGGDLLIGSVAVGAALASLAGAATYFLTRRSANDAFASLVRRASNRYVDGGIVSWEFARGKLRGDPIYRAVVCDGLLTPSWSSPERPPARTEAPATLVDIGCGIGLTLALLAEARSAVRAGTWPGKWPVPPSFDRMIGIELRPRVAAVAGEALAGEAEVIAGDARSVIPPRAHTVLLFDVLHLMAADEQNALLSAVALALEPNGVLVIREADASAGWRFTAVRLGNRLKALTFGSWRQQFCFRTAAEWLACVARLGLHAELCDMSSGTPFANVMLVARNVTFPNSDQTSQVSTPAQGRAIRHCS